MSSDQEISTLYRDLPSIPFQLAAHTASATALSEKLFNGHINKSDYDAQILPTTIKSAIKLASVPIIMTTDDSLAAILTQAGQEPDKSPPDREKVKLCLCCSTRLVGFIGLPVSRDLVTLDRDELKKLLTFLRESNRTDQLLVTREDDILGPEYLKMVMIPKRYPEGVTHASKD